MSSLTQKTFKPNIRPRVSTSVFKKALAKVCNGMSVKDFDSLKNNLKVSEAELCSLLSLNPRTLSRRRQQNLRFTKSESDRILRISRVFNLAVETLGCKHDAVLWFSSPQLAIDNVTPLELLDTELGSREVENLLFQIQYGIFS